MSDTHERLWHEWYSVWHDADASKAKPSYEDWLEARIEAAERERAELRGMGHADLQTLGDGRDYALAAYMLIDSKVTKEASLRELCVAASKDGCISRNDWEGIREYWWRAALAAREKRA